MTKAIIIDDEEPARRTLQNYLTKYCGSIEVIGEADGVESGKEIISTLNPDLIFLDIHMKDGTGFDLLQQINYSDLLVIFITAYDEYALKAFNFNAIHYILKPIDPLELVESISKIEKLKNNFNQISINGLMNYNDSDDVERIILHTMGEMHIVQLDDIIRLQADGPYTIFFLSDGQKITVSKSIKEYESLLCESFFYRCHNSHIISTKRIKSINSKDNLIKMKNGDSINLARSKKDGLIELLNN